MQQQPTTDARLAAVKDLDGRLASAARGQREQIKAEVARFYGLSKRQLWRLYTAFKAAGPAALQPHAGPRQRERLITQDNWFGQKIRAFLLAAPGAGPSQVRDALSLACQREAKTCPSIPTVRRYLSDLRAKEQAEADPRAASPAALFDPAEAVATSLSEQLDEVVGLVQEHGLLPELLDRLDALAGELSRNPMRPSEIEVLDHIGVLFIEFAEVAGDAADAALAKRLISLARTKGAKYRARA